MDKVNVERIKARLLGLGFDHMVEEKLMAQVCFGAAAFDLRFDKMVGEDACSFLVRVERGGGGEFVVAYYSALFRKGFGLGTSALKLAERMSRVDWKQLALARAFVVVVELPIVQEAYSLLEEITKSPEVSLLLYKYWAGTSLESLVPDFVSLKAKYELMQRFYVSEEHQPITSDEAIRFLQNRWMEKAMQQSRLQQRQAGGGNDNESVTKRVKRKSSRKK